jgi:hypothetical protein
MSIFSNLRNKIKDTQTASEVLGDISAIQQRMIESNNRMIEANREYLEKTQGILSRMQQSSQSINKFLESIDNK